MHVTVRRRSRLVRSVLAVGLAVFALVGCLAVIRPVAAAEPRNLPSQLTDDVNALDSAGEAQVRGALDKLLTQSGVQLWVWYTDTTGSLSAPEFAAQTAQLSSFGGTDLLLVLALDSQRYGYSRPEAFPLSDTELQRLLSSALEPGLRNKDYAGAVAGFVDALGNSLAGGPVPTGPVATTGPVPTERPADGGSRDTGFGLGTVLAVIVVVGIVAAVGWWFLYRRRAGPAGSIAGTPPAPGDEFAAMSDSQLNDEANRLLIATDDAVRDSEQELGFAEAEFGEAEAVPFREAIAAAKDDLRAAFQVRQQLDDSTPEDRPTRRRMLVDLIGQCRRAQGRLDAQTERFEQLRAFERQAPEILSRLPADAAAVEARIPPTEQTMTHLREYADASWQAVTTNLDEARTRLAAVRAAVTEGEAARAAGDGHRLTAATKAGQDALGQAGAFLHGIERLAKELDDARDRVAAELADAEADLARAKATVGAAPADPGLTGRLAEAEALLAQARSDLAPPKPDVASAYRRARQANEIADAILATIRTAQEEQARLTARLDSSIRSAQATLTRASDYVATRRGGVGGEARTRLAEAGRHVDQAVALGAADPAAGVREAEEATRLANEALAIAQRDYDGWDDPWRGGGRGGGGSDIAAAVIGGIIGGMLSGGGRGGGFPGRGGFGGGWGGGGGGFGGGGRTSGGGRW